MLMYAVCMISNYTLRPYTPLFRVMMISQIMSTLKSLEKKKSIRFPKLAVISVKNILSNGP